MRLRMLIGTLLICLLTVLPSAKSTVTAQTPDPTGRTVFMIVFENHSWSSIKNNPTAPYINSLLSLGAHAEQYYTPPNLHPSEPNYIWLEAGNNFGIHNDSDPGQNHITSPDHLVNLLEANNISWTSYQENISGDKCPLKSDDGYAAKHNPMIFFDDVSDNNNPNSARCIAHVRPYSELSAALENNTVARYNFISPNLCHDMHGAIRCLSLRFRKDGDDWLSHELPSILASSAYQNGGVVFIVWDEGTSDNDGPIGLIILSPDAKVGYSNNIHYTHSSTLRTIQEIFDVKPYLGDAANAEDLSDLFVKFP